MINDVRNMSIMLINKKKNADISNEALKVLVANSVVKADSILEVGISEIEKERLIKELFDNFSKDSTTGALLKNKNDINHKPWLKNKKEEIKFKHWNRYKKYLINNKGWAVNVVDKIDDSTEQILDLIEDPAEKGRAFDRRGLAFGYVQSGKTAHYTGLINKSIDVGYKFIIVLAGMHNDLRSQTQMRLDAEVLGYETSLKHIEKKNLDINNIGVGSLPGENFFEVYALTSRADNGDFSSKRTVAPALESTFLIVAKKNKSVLTHILNMLENHPKTMKVNDTDKKIIKNVPLLLIDDEADQASVDTSNIYDEDKQLLEEYDPKTINGLIRKVYEIFDQKVYLGYTATPFANVLINQDAATREYGYDLFPRDFIVNLPKSVNYVGPWEYFRPDEEIKTLPLVNEIYYDNDFAPFKHDKLFIPKKLPESLVEAVYSFIIATAIRRSRGQIKVHNSMLIHVTRFKDVQTLITDLVSSLVKDIQSDLENGLGKGNHSYGIKKLFDKKFNSPRLLSIQNMYPDQFDENYETTWKIVEKFILPSVKSLNVKSINGNSKDSLEYDDYKNGLNVIAIGGDKLSRGLTLEGLTVSYYLRASKMYDTLMQMGRWFGYRQNYLDVCQLYTTNSLIGWFRHVAVATEDLREQLDYMADINAEPNEFIIKLKSHPNLYVTSTLKMRAAKGMKVNYNNELIQTTVFPKNNEEFYRENYFASKTLINNIDEKYDRSPNLDMRLSKTKSKHHYWTGVNSKDILEFFDNYKTVSTASRANSQAIAKYIRSLNEVNELTDWTVVLINTGTGNYKFSHDITVGKGVIRNGNAERINPNLFSIKALKSSEHEFFDYSLSMYSKAKEIIKADKIKKELQKRQDEGDGFEGDVTESIKQKTAYKTRQLRDKNKGLLILYPFINEENIDDSFSFENESKPIAFLAIFPPTESKNAEVDYVVNKSIREEEIDYDNFE